MQNWIKLASILDQIGPNFDVICDPISHQIGHEMDMKCDHISQLNHN